MNCVWPADVIAFRYWDVDKSTFTCRKHNHTKPCFGGSQCKCVRHVKSREQETQASANNASFNLSLHPHYAKAPTPAIFNQDVHQYCTYPNLNFVYATLTTCAYHVDAVTVEYCRLEHQWDHNSECVTYRDCIHHHQSKPVDHHSDYISMLYWMDYQKSRVVGYQLEYIHSLKKGASERVWCIHLDR